MIERAADRECAPKTHNWYRSTLDLFIPFLSQTGHSLDITQVTPAQVRAFRLYLQQPQRWDGARQSRRPLSDSTRQIYHRALRIFFG